MITEVNMGRKSLSSSKVFVIVAKGIVVIALYILLKVTYVCKWKDYNYYQFKQELI